MHNNSAIAVDFYSAFQDKDALKMASLYHVNVEFEDPAFGKLKGDEVGAMWKMLCERSSDLTIKFELIASKENQIDVKWIASYSFGKSKRKVINSIVATLSFEDGKIIKHKDVFNLYKWSRQALGFSGYLLGWTSFFKHKLNAKTRIQLDAFMKKA